MLIVAYDGTDFHGWQLQPGVRTVESELNKAISQLVESDISVIGASRTDTGVHAKGNVAVFDTVSTIPAEKFAYALNTILPEDVKIQKSLAVADDFHPRHCNSVKTYEYRIYSGEFPNPLKRRNSFYTYYKPDISKMQEGASYLVGEHDFKSFCCVRTQAETTVRRIYNISVTEDEDEICIRVSGNGFLYNMVRIIAGTLLEVGRGKYPPSYIKEMLDAANRCAAGPTAPPEGLCLCGIEFIDL